MNKFKNYMNKESQMSNLKKYLNNLLVFYADYFEHVYHA